MSGTKDYPPIPFIRNCLRYKDGKLYWIKRPVHHFANQRLCNSWNGRWVGREAGTIQVVNGHSFRAIVFRRMTKTHILAHTIVWALHVNEWRLGIDHKNRDSLDNRFSNLRVATQSQNMANAKLRSDNTSGFKGVSRYGPCSHQWRVRLSVNKRPIEVGIFEDLEDARRAYIAAAREHYGEFATEGQ